MQRITQFLERTNEFNSLVEGINHRLSQQSVYGLSGSQKAFLTANLIEKVNKPALLVTYSDEQALEMTANMQDLLGEENVLYFPVLEWMPFKLLGRSKEIEAKRIKVLAQVQERRPMSIVTTIHAIERLFTPKKVWVKLSKQLRVGESFELETLFRDLLDMGYERVGLLEGPGQFSVRGGILDIYPLSNDPVRLEFFDDELDSIRIIDPITQRSTEQRQEATIYPAREMVVPAVEREKAWPNIHRDALRIIARLRKHSQQSAEELQGYLDSLAEKHGEGIYDENFEQFFSSFYPQLDSFFDYIPVDNFIVFDEAARIKEYLEFTVRERAEEYTNLLEAGQLFVEPSSLFMDYGQLLNFTASRQGIFLSTLPRQVPGVRPNNLVTFSTQPVQGFTGKTGSFAKEIKELKEQGYGVAVFAGNETQANRLSLLLRDYGISAPVLNSPLGFSQVGILPLGLKGGFKIPLAKLAVFTEHEVAKGEKKPRPKAKVKGKTEKLQLFDDLKPGDYVVHASHGIGMYIGVEKLEIGGIARDYFLIKYAGEDKLYVPFDQVNLMQKYLGGEGQAPKLYKLGGNEWLKVKSKVKAAVKDMAEDLLKLYAEREKAVGYSFSEDNVWQNEFEEKFPYEETPDQLQCIKEVKADMMKPQIMDRVICGDVGYGKTEVAIRAAFKAVLDGKQVAVLVPTTILAQQHFVTFSERFMGYPMTIEMLSRFRSPKEQKQVIEGLKDGSVDVVIGTHRLVSEDIRFKDLGLVIVDEEQRFGVAHKEKLKILKGNVDVLTLSATPIPRTLHMALVNIRDMSVIETPPEDRYPVQTYVAEFSPEMVREALRRELSRGGQVFYVHNRIQDLDKIAAELQKLVPEARIALAHGQMREDELEQVMLDFMEKQFDVLVCTTIIETGLDIPNVNTLIVSDADHMGLSQLYQLRGRVGRSNRKAFAYFLYRKDKILTEVAEKRLSAIRDFTEFGSGFKIAMRDLEIRGAGNLLGGEQHGHMAAVGFDMYCKLLGQAVQELKGETKEELVEPTIELNVDAHFTTDYISEGSLKMGFYQRLMRARNLPALDDIIEEIIDRFGDPPQPVARLFEIVGIRIKAMKIAIASISEEKGAVKFKFGRDPDLSGDQLMELAQKVGPTISFSAAEGLEIKLKLSPRADILKQIDGLLTALIKIADKPLALV